MRDKLTEMFDRMMKALFREQGANLEINILASEEAQDFIETHASVLDSSFRQVEMSEAMRGRLQRSDYIFSGLKTFHELNEAFPSLLDENGNRKTFERFLNDVRKIDETYNRGYLRAEYNFVQAGRQVGTVRRRRGPLQPPVPDGRGWQGSPGTCRTAWGNTTYGRPLLGRVFPAKWMELQVHRSPGTKIQISGNALR